MPTPIQDDIRNAMQNGGTLNISFDAALNIRAPQKLSVFLHQVSTSEVRIDLLSGGEPADILWLPWKQGELPMLQEYSVEHAAENTLFFTYTLTGCKVFAIQNGPVWHIDSEVKVDEFWPRIRQSEWVEDNWPVGSVQNVAYLHRAGQPNNLWDLSAYLTGGAPTTYGQGNVGAATVGGIVREGSDGKYLDLYYQGSPWKSLPATEQKLIK